MESDFFFLIDIYIYDRRAEKIGGTKERMKVKGEKTTTM